MDYFMTIPLELHCYSFLLVIIRYYYLRYWSHRTDDWLGNPLRSYQEPLVVKTDPR